MSIDLDRLFGSLNLATTILNGDFSGFELTSYTDVPSENTGALNESCFTNSARGMQFYIHEWPDVSRVALCDTSNAFPLAEVEYNADDPMLELLLKKLNKSAEEIALHKGKKTESLDAHLVKLNNSLTKIKQKIEASTQALAQLSSLPLTTQATADDDF